MRRVMAVVDQDAEYGKRLVSYFNEQSSIGFRATAFSELESFRRFCQSVQIEILLISESLAHDAHGLTGNAKVILLSEDGFVAGKEHRPFGAAAVFKYLPADRMSRELMKIYADDDSHTVTRVRSSQCEIIGVYSPVNRCGKTTLAITLGMVRASRGRTLLISLEEYAGVFMNISRNAEEDLSDVIYCYLQGSYSWSRLKSKVHSFGSLDYIPPVRCIEDVSQISSEDMSRLIRRIAEESGYATIILDFGSFGRRASELLESCDRIFMPVTEDPLATLKLDSFYEYLDKAEKAELKERLIKCNLPYDKEKAQDYARALISVYESGSLYDYAAELH